MNRSIGEGVGLGLGWRERKKNGRTEVGKMRRERGGGEKGRKRRSEENPRRREKVTKTIKVKK